MYSGLVLDIYRLAGPAFHCSQDSGYYGFCISTAVSKFIIERGGSTTDHIHSVAALSIIHLHYVSEYTNSSNPGLALIPVLAVQQVQLCWSLISATIPNLKAFVKSFSSGFGIQLDPSQTQAYGSSGRYGRGTGYEMGSVRADGNSKSRSGNASYNDIEGPTALPQEGQTHGNQAKRGDQESINSGGSQDHIIRKDVRWKIHYETNDGHAS